MRPDASQTTVIGGDTVNELLSYNLLPARSAPHRRVLVVAPPAELREITRSWRATGSVITACPGPSAGHSCPLLDGCPCPLLAEVPIVLNGLADDAGGAELAAALGEAAPEVTVISVGPR